MKIKKAILTGGGRGTRLHPITTTTNKHLLPIANRPMLYHAIEKVVAAGVEEVFINTNPGDTELEQAIGDGGHWGISITYFEQTGGPQGIAHVVNEAKKFIGDDPFIFYLSDNIILADLNELVDKYTSGGYDCMLALSEVPDPERFGVPVFDEDGETLVDVLEKPSNPPNNFAVTGIYVYGPGIFFDAFDKITKSSRGEYEISDIHSQLIKEGKKVGYSVITGWWKDTGKPKDLLLANQLVLDTLDANEYHVHGTVHESIDIGEKVHIGSGTQIGEGVILHGPVMIGENCTIMNCEIGPHVTIGSGVTVNDIKIEHSMVLDNSHVSGPWYMRESMIGKHVSARHTSGDKTKPVRVMLADKTVFEDLA